MSTTSTLQTIEMDFEVKKIIEEEKRKRGQSHFNSQEKEWDTNVRAERSKSLLWSAAVTGIPTFAVISFLSKKIQFFRERRVWGFIIWWAVFDEVSKFKDIKITRNSIEGLFKIDQSPLSDAVYRRVKEKYPYYPLLKTYSKDSAQMEPSNEKKSVRVVTPQNTSTTRKAPRDTYENLPSGSSTYSIGVSNEVTKNKSPEPEEDYEEYIPSYYNYYEEEEPPMTQNQNPSASKSNNKISNIDWRAVDFDKRDSFEERRKIIMERKRQQSSMYE